MITTDARTAATLKQVRKATTPIPARAGKNWFPIDHGELLDNFEVEIQVMGWETTTLAYSLSSGGADLVAGFGLAPSRLEGWKLKWGVPSLVLRNSNSRTRALAMYVGVLVSEGEWIGVPLHYIPLAKRHTNGVNLNVILMNGLLEAQARFAEIPDTIKSMRHAGMTGEEAEHAVLEAGRSQLLPWHLIGQVDKHVLVDPNQETGDGDVFEWDMLVGFAKAAGRWNVPFYQLERVMKFGKLLSSYPAAEEATV
jgi:hypothetical protein